MTLEPGDELVRHVFSSTQFTIFQGAQDPSLTLVTVGLGVVATLNVAIVAANWRPVDLATDIFTYVWLRGTQGLMLATAEAAFVLAFIEFTGAPNKATVVILVIGILTALIAALTLSIRREVSVISYLPSVEKRVLRADRLASFADELFPLRLRELARTANREIRNSLKFWVWSVGLAIVLGVALYSALGRLEGFTLDYVRAVLNIVIQTTFSILTITTIGWIAARLIVSFFQGATIRGVSLGSMFIALVSLLSPLFLFPYAHEDLSVINASTVIVPSIPPVILLYLGWFCRGPGTHYWISVINAIEWRKKTADDMQYLARRNLRLARMGRTE